MAKFRYAPIPEEVLCDPRLSWTMKGRYGLLVGAAFNREALRMSLEGIARLWSEAEGRHISPESVGAYLATMAQAGLIRRQQLNRYDWETMLLKRYDPRSHSAATATAQPQPATAQPTVETPMPSRGLEFETPISSEGLRPGSGALVTSELTDVVDVWTQIDNLQQHQQLVIVNTLLRIGVKPKTALEFAQTRPWGVVRDWVCYALTNEGIRRPDAFVVAGLGANETPPFPPVPGSTEARQYRQILRDLGVPEEDI